MGIYLDNSASTTPYTEVIEAVSDCMKNYYANPSSIYSIGEMAKNRLNQCRRSIAGTINCAEEEIVFTSGGSESNNFLIKGVMDKNCHVITSSIEHSSVLNSCRELEGRGVKVTYLGVDSMGRIDLEELLGSINKDTRLVSIMQVNNETGVIQDIKAIGRAIKEKNSNVLFHVDAVQGYGKLPIDVKEYRIDMLSVSAHKIHGPRGIGFAYVRKGLNLKPLVSGGGQENKMRSGTENLPGVVGLETAALKINRHREENYIKVAALKQHFAQLISEIPEIRINGEFSSSFLPHIINVSAIGIRSGKILFYLDDKGVYVSKSSACSARKLEDSHVLKAMKLNPEVIKGSFRVSFSEENTLEEIDYAAECIKQCIDSLKAREK